MRRGLLQLDSWRLPSSFDAIVAHDGGADALLSYGGVTPADVRDLIHGAIFTRGLKNLHNTAAFIGGSDMAVGEALLAAAQKAFFGPLRISLMLDPNGSNTTAVAAVMKILGAVNDVRARRVVVVAGTGPVGTRAAGLLAKAGADVVITSRHPEDGARVSAAIEARFGAPVGVIAMHDASEAGTALQGATVLLNAGPAGVQLVPRQAWAARPGLEVAVDLNAVPPLGIEGIESADDGARRDGVTTFGAIGVGGLKMWVHKACIARLFERNALVLDAETIAEVGRELARGRTET